MTPEVTTLVQSFPSVLEFTIVMGVMAGALMAIVKLWQFIRPDITPEISALKADISKDIAVMKFELDKDIEDVYTKIESLTSRASKIERDIAAIDISQINKRFDRMETKIDDLTNLLITKFSQNNRL